MLEEHTSDPEDIKKKTQQNLKIKEGVIKDPQPQQLTPPPKITTIKIIPILTKTEGLDLPVDFDSNILLVDLEDDCLTCKKNMADCQTLPCRHVVQCYECAGRDTITTPYCIKCKNDISTLRHFAKRKTDRVWRVVAETKVEIVKLEI